MECLQRLYLQLRLCASFGSEYLRERSKNLGDALEKSRFKYIDAFVFELSRNTE